VCHCFVGAAALLGCEGSGGHGPAGAVLPGQEGSSDGINYYNADNATRGEGRTKTTSKESGHLTTQGNNDGSKDGGGDITLRASYSPRRPLRV
jgi:hypothetical protein